jgi:hypothetical protein
LLNRRRQANAERGSDAARLPRNETGKALEDYSTLAADLMAVGVTFDDPEGLASINSNNIKVQSNRLDEIDMRRTTDRSVASVS